MIIKVIKWVINNGIHFFRYLASGCSFHDYISIFGLESQQQARQSQKYGVVFALSCVQNILPHLQQRSGN